MDSTVTRFFFRSATWAPNPPEVCLFGGFFGAAYLVALDPYELYDESLHASDLEIVGNLSCFFLVDLLEIGRRFLTHTFFGMRTYVLFELGNFETLRHFCFFVPIVREFRDV